MRKLDQDVVERIRENYPLNWAEAMLNPEKIEKGLSFIERNANDISLTYEQVFFSPNGFDVYELNGETRVFTVENSVFKTTPLTEKDAEGDWQGWLKKATKIKEIR